MSSASSQLDTTDKRLLDIIQTGFPICSRPYAELGRQLKLTEAEALARVRALRGRGIIRRLGANFRSNALGFTSTLCAASVPAERLDAFVAEVNSHVGVTHNYLRNHHYNVWFTVIAPSSEALQELLAGISERTGIRVLNLPATRMYKIRVDFQMEE